MTHEDVFGAWDWDESRSAYLLFYRVSAKYYCEISGHHTVDLVVRVTALLFITTKDVKQK